MFFGYSTGDFVLLVQLAHKTIRDCQKAGEEYTEIVREIRSLRSVLRILRSEAERPDSKILKQDLTSTKELIAIADGCKDVLNKVDAVLFKYEGLGSDGKARAGKKLLHKLRFGSKIEELNVIRGKLITYTSAIPILLDAMQIKAADRREAKIDDGLSEMKEMRGEMKDEFRRMRKEIYMMASQARAAERNGSTMSLLSLSTYNGDDTKVWKDFRRELINKGFQSQSLDKHSAALQAYMLKLDETGVLEDEYEIEIAKACNTTSGPAHSSKYDSVPVRTDGRERRAEGGARHQRQKIGDQTYMEEFSSLPQLDKPTPLAKTITIELGSIVGPREGITALITNRPNLDEGLTQPTPTPIPQPLNPEKLLLLEARNVKNQGLECCTNNRSSISSEQRTAQCKYSPGFKSLADYRWRNTSDIANVHESLRAFVIKWMSGSSYAEKEERLESSDSEETLPWGLLFTGFEEPGKTIIIRRFRIKRLKATILDGRMQLRRILISRTLAREIIGRKTILFLIRYLVVRNYLEDLFNEHLEIEQRRQRLQQREAERQRETQRRLKRDAFERKKRLLQETCDGREL